MTAWRRWVELLGREEAATPIAITRIIVGLSLVGHLVHMVATGAHILVWTRPEDGGMRALEPLWLAWIGGTTPTNILALVTVTALAALLFALGLFTRPAAVVAWLGFRTLADLNNHSGGAYDELLKNELFILMLSGCGKALSLDALRGKGGPTTAWARYVLLFQLVLMYQTTGLQKVSAGWVPGGNLDALWYIFQQPTWQRWEMYWLAPFYPLTQLATLGTWVFEVGAPVLLLCLYYRDTRTRPGRLRALFNRLDVRTLFLAWGVGMHLGIEVSMEVGMFSFGSLALYSCFFHPDELAAVARRLRRR